MKETYLIQLTLGTQFVVVGDQSAGKSSLLQSLTGIPFPIADHVGTRFPIKVVSRRAPRGTSITKVSIEPATFDPFRLLTLDEKPDETFRRLRACSEFAYSKSDITLEEFREAIERVSPHQFTGVDGTKFEGTGEGAHGYPTNVQV